MVLGTVTVVATTPIAIAVGTGSAAAATGGGVAVAVAGGSATTASSAAIAAVGQAASEVLVSSAASLIASGPGGWITLGKDGDSWDCWRAVLHDFDSPAARGRLLKNVATDPRVVEVRSETQDGYWPQFWLKNQWDEEFRIDYVLLEGGEIAAHATRVD